MWPVEVWSEMIGWKVEASLEQELTSQRLGVPIHQRKPQLQATLESHDFGSALLRLNDCSIAEEWMHVTVKTSSYHVQGLQN